MSCQVDPHLRESGTAASDDISAQTPDQWDSKVLVLSDAPERIPQELDRTILPLLDGEESETLPSPRTYTTHTLYKCEVPLTTSAKTFRVYLWHQSFLSSDAYLQIIAHTDVDAASVTVSGFKTQETIQIHDGGLCTAVAMLYSTLDDATPQTTSLDGMEKQLWNASIAKNGGFRGAVVEFTLTASAACNVRIRTAVNTSTAIPGAWSDDPAWPGQEKLNEEGEKEIVTHSRGWWPKTAIRMLAGTLDVKPVQGPVPSQEFTVFPVATGRPETETPEGFGRQASGDQHGTEDGNDGCWGATLCYDVTLTNTTLDGRKYGAQAWIVCRGTNAAYYGAVRIELPTLFPERRLDDIQSTSNGTYQMAELTRNASDKSTPIYLSPGDQVTLRVTLVNGGGAVLPVNVVVAGGVAFEELMEPR